MRLIYGPHRYRCQLSRLDGSLCSLSTNDQNSSRIAAVGGRQDKRIDMRKSRVWIYSAKRKIKPTNFLQNCKYASVLGASKSVENKPRTAKFLRSRQHLMAKYRRSWLKRCAPPSIRSISARGTLWAEENCVLRASIYPWFQNVVCPREPVADLCPHTSIP